MFERRVEYHSALIVCWNGFILSNGLAIGSSHRFEAAKKEYVRDVGEMGEVQ